MKKMNQKALFNVHHRFFIVPYVRFGRAVHGGLERTRYFFAETPALVRSSSGVHHSVFGQWPKEGQSLVPGRVRSGSWLHVGSDPGTSLATSVSHRIYSGI